MRLASLLYLPPPHLPCAAGIMDNLRRYPAKHQLVVYSDHPYDWPGLIRLKASPEQVKSLDNPAKPKGFLVSNLVWLTGLRIAIRNGFSHVLYVEADSRVGCPSWDDKIFSEYFSYPRPLIAAGTLVAYNPSNWNLEAARRWQALVARNTRRNVPVATYGWKGAADKHPCCVFPNGSLSVLDVQWMRTLFASEVSDGQSVNAAAAVAPWDMELGKRLWAMFEEDSYEVVGVLESVFSGYGDILTSEADRLAMLADGKTAAVHQVKSGAQPK